MNRIDAVTDALRSVVQIIVALPGCVAITPQRSLDAAGREMTLFEIHVNEADRTKLLGEGWANLRALRRLVKSAGCLSGEYYYAKLQ